MQEIQHELLVSNATENFITLVLYDLVILAESFLLAMLRSSKIMYTDDKLVPT